MPEYEVPGTDCRQSIEGGFRLGSIGVRQCPGLRILIMRAIFYVCSVSYTFKNRGSESQTGSVRGGDSFRIVTLSRRINKCLIFN
jgi:hypothetical protein